MTQGPEHLPYEGRLLQMGLLRLGGERRLRGGRIEVGKTMPGVEDVEREAFLSLSPK